MLQKNQDTKIRANALFCFSALNILFYKQKDIETFAFQFFIWYNENVSIICDKNSFGQILFFLLKKHNWRNNGLQNLIKQRTI